MDAQRFALDVPVNHDAATAVADMPLCRQVLIPGTEVLGIGRARICAGSPDCGIRGTGHIFEKCIVKALYAQ